MAFYCQAPLHTRTHKYAPNTQAGMYKSVNGWYHENCVGGMSEKGVLILQLIDEGRRDRTLGQKWILKYTLEVHSVEDLSTYFYVVRDFESEQPGL